jgi:hypothetical protein
MPAAPTPADAPAHRSIRSRLGPTDKMVTDLTSGIITPVSDLAFLKRRYNLSEDFSALRPFREALCIFAETAGSVLVLMNPHCTTILGYVDDPRTDLDDRQMIVARLKLFALLTPDVLDAYNVVLRVDGRDRFSDYCVAVMPRYAYRKSDAAAAERYSIRNFYLSLRVDEQR